MSSAKFVKAVLEKKRAEVENLSDQIFNLAETGFHEFQTVKLYEEALKKEGFEVICGLAGMPTAFRASYGSGKPSVGFLAEYDALPELSQMGGCTMRKPAEGTNPDGHGCGHNLLGAGAFGAALAVKEWLKDHPEAGSCLLYTSRCV